MNRLPPWICVNYAWDNGKSYATSCRNLVFVISGDFCGAWTEGMVATAGTLDTIGSLRLMLRKPRVNALQRMQPPGYQHAFLLRVARTQSLHQCTVLRASSLQQLAACALLLVHMCMAGTKMHRRAAILVKHALHELAKFSVNCREGVSHQRICKGVFAGSCTTTYFAVCLVICRSVRCIG